MTEITPEKVREMLAKANQEALSGYINEALGAWGGQMRPDDALFLGIKAKRISVRRKDRERNLYNHQIG